MSALIFRQLKEHYDEATKTCQHTRTHPRGCDDCPAIWCPSCSRHHKEPIGLGCKFSRMLHDHATVLMHESLHHDTQVVSLNKRIRGLEARNQFLNEKLLNVHNLWTCEMCGFSMHAEHHNEDGTYSCPVCAEQELFAENWNLKTELKKKSELIAIITKAVNE